MAIEPISVKIILDNQEQQLIPENEDVDIVVTNNISSLRNVDIFVNKTKILTFDILEGKQSYAVAFNVSDFVGPNTISIRDSEGRKLTGEKKFFVTPQGMSIEEINKIKEERIPSLMDSVGGQRIIEKAVPTGSKRLVATKTDVSIEKLFAEEIDYSLLQKYSRSLLDLTKKIMNPLGYRSRKLVRTTKGAIRGRINWHKTLQLQPNRGVEGKIYHVWEKRRKSYDILMNELLYFFHLEILKGSIILVDHLIIQEEEKNYWNRVLGLEETHDPEVRSLVHSLRGLGLRHTSILMPSMFDEVRKNLPGGVKEFRKLHHRLKAEAKIQKNRSYRELVTLWEDFLENFYTKKIEETSLDSASMEEVFNLWLFLELAFALHLKPARKGGERYYYSNDDGSVRMKYEKLLPTRRTWIEGIFPEPPEEDEEALSLDMREMVPDIYLNYCGHKILINSHYFGSDEEGKRVKLSNLLANMNAYNINIGLLMYQGDRFKVRLNAFSPEQVKIVCIVPFTRFQPPDQAQIEAPCAESPEDLSTEGPEDLSTEGPEDLSTASEDKPTEDREDFRRYFEDIIRETVLLSKIIGRYQAKAGDYGFKTEWKDYGLFIWEVLKGRLERRIRNFEDHVSATYLQTLSNP
jgi:hypothetical protein